MKIDDYLPALEEEIGPMENIEEWVPGVFFIEADQGGTSVSQKSQRYTRFDRHI